MFGWQSKLHWFSTKHNVGFVCSLQGLEAELLKHLAERREHEREVAQKALTKEHQEHRVHAHHEQRHMLLNASQDEEVSLIPKPDPELCQVQDQVTNTGFSWFLVSGRAHCGGEDEELEEEGVWVNVP